MRKSYHANSIDYIIEQESDGWFSIYEFQDGLPLKPLLQAKTLKHAYNYCEMREPALAGLKKLA